MKVEKHEISPSLRSCSSSSGTIERFFHTSMVSTDCHGGGMLGFNCFVFIFFNNRHNARHICCCGWRKERKKKRGKRKRKGGVEAGGEGKTARGGELAGEQCSLLPPGWRGEEE
jgi:hypothetical protein